MKQKSKYDYYANSTRANLTQLVTPSAEIADVVIKYWPLSSSGKSM